MAAIQATGDVFPNASRTGCFFHLTQNIHRRIQGAGLQGRYEGDANFALQCRMISAIAFVPPVDVADAFETLSGEVPNELRPIMDYFEDNSIGRPDRRGVRRDPLFGIDLWNQYERVLHGHNRTTNSVEAWHRSIKSLLGVSHPTIFKFINGLSRCQKLRDVQLEQLLAGHRSRQRRTVYVMRDRRMRTIVADYVNRTTMDYLRGLSHNIRH